MSKNKKVVLLAGMKPDEAGRCQGIIEGADIHMVHDQKEALNFIQRNPEIVVICVDDFAHDILQQIANTGFKGKLISVTNKCKTMRASNVHIAPRDVPEAVIEALSMLPIPHGKQQRVQV